MQPSKTRGDTDPRLSSSKEPSAAPEVFGSWDILLPPLLEALPREIEARADFLDALVRVVPHRHPAYQQIRASRAHLDMHILAQRELPFSATRGSGRLGDNPAERGTGRIGDESRERGGAR